MAWELRIFNETGATLQKTVRDTDLIPAIHGGFRVAVTSFGDCLSFTFRGRNDLLKIRPRQIVQFVADGQALFWGPITRAPNLGSQGAGFDDATNEADLEEFVAEGGRVLLAGCASGNRYIETSEEVADIFREFLYLYGPLSLRTNLTAIENTGFNLALFYRPQSPLDVLLDELVATAPGWVWGVNADGRVFLRELAGLISVEAELLMDFMFRPVQAEDVVSKVNLVIAGSPGGRVPEAEDYFNNDHTLYDVNSKENNRFLYDYVPAPIVFTYEHPLHSVFRAEKSFALPEGVTPFLEPNEVTALFTSSGGQIIAYVNDWVDSANMYDNDSSTFAYTDSATWPTNANRYTHYVATGWSNDPVTVPHIVGFRLVYSAQFGAAAYSNPDARTHPSVVMQQAAFAAGNDPQFNNYKFSSELHTASVAERFYTLRSTYDSVSASGTAVGFYAVNPPPVQHFNINRDGTWTTVRYITELRLQATNAVGRSRIYHFYPLALNTALLTEVAKSNLRLPSTMAGDVVVEGYSPPMPVVEILNLFPEPIGSPPSVNMMEAVETVEYLLSPEEGFITRYVVGNDDVSDAGKLLQRYVRDGISAANYLLTMG